MERIRSYYDADRSESPVPTAYKTKDNQHELLCSECGQTVFVNEIIFADIKRVSEKTFDNPFLCEDCIQEHDEMAHDR